MLTPLHQALVYAGEYRVEVRRHGIAEQVLTVEKDDYAYEKLPSNLEFANVHRPKEACWCTLTVDNNLYWYGSLEEKEGSTFQIQLFGKGPFQLFFSSSSLEELSLSIKRVPHPKQIKIQPKTVVTGLKGTFILSTFSNLLKKKSSSPIIFQLESSSDEKPIVENSHLSSPYKISMHLAPIYASQSFHHESEPFTIDHPQQKVSISLNSSHCFLVPIPSKRREEMKDHPKIEETQICKKMDSMLSLVTGSECGSNIQSLLEAVKIQCLVSNLQHHTSVVEEQRELLLQIEDHPKVLYFSSDILRIRSMLLGHDMLSCDALVKRSKSTIRSTTHPNLLNLLLQFRQELQQLLSHIQNHMDHLESLVECAVKPPWSTVIQQHVLYFYKLHLPKSLLKIVFQIVSSLQKNGDLYFPTLPTLAHKDPFLHSKDAYYLPPDVVSDMHKNNFNSVMVTIIRNFAFYLKRQQHVHALHETHNPMVRYFLRSLILPWLRAFFHHGLKGVETLLPPSASSESSPVSVRPPVLLFFDEGLSHPPLPSLDAYLLHWIGGGHLFFMIDKLLKQFSLLSKFYSPEAYLFAFHQKMGSKDYLQMHRSLQLIRLLDAFQLVPSTPF